MFVGHLAVAFGAKRITPRVPLAALIASVYALDLLWALLVVAGVERVRVEPGNTAFTPLAFDSYPWSHSLLMTLVWSSIAGLAAAAWLRSGVAGWMIAAAVASHWALDYVTHRPDLPLWPGGPKYGLGLWNSIAGTLIVEGALFIGAVEAYRRAFRARDPAGGWSFWSLVVLLGALWIAGAWGPPPPNATAVAAVALGMWLFPLWGAWIDRHRG
jgi:membrane-bound metal-dependent hydrolase YbcI (DUF457 family)